MIYCGRFFQGAMGAFTAISAASIADLATEDDVRFFFCEAFFEIDWIFIE
jgi:hypothetical protein